MHWVGFSWLPKLQQKPDGWLRNGHFPKIPQSSRGNKADCLEVRCKVRSWELGKLALLSERGEGGCPVE